MNECRLMRRELYFSYKKSVIFQVEFVIYGLKQASEVNVHTPGI